MNVKLYGSVFLPYVLEVPAVEKHYSTGPSMFARNNRDIVINMNIYICFVTAMNPIKITVTVTTGVDCIKMIAMSSLKSFSCCYIFLWNQTY